MTDKTSWTEPLSLDELACVYGYSIEGVRVAAVPLRAFLTSFRRPRAWQEVTRELQSQAIPHRDLL